ncbi:MAG: hypothetical protein SH857_01780 [Chitinophagales bacterium]|nr:hypothetical protein [Chitinophagales bacterium]
MSVLIRIPTLNRPLSKHHEFCTAVSLRVMQIWDAAGIATYNFNPVMTYPNAADKFINNYASGSGKMLDEQGNYYYVSHPPLAYYVPYFLFQLIGVRPDVLPIQLFNLLLHFISAVGVYLIVKQLIKNQNASWFDSAHHDQTALAGFVLYLFSAATLWFQSNTYMSDMAVQPLFISGVLFALKYFQSGKRKHLILLSLFIFLMTYTTWLGVFFAAGVLLYGIVQMKRIASPGLFIGLILLCAFLAVSLTLFQYAQIAGWDAYREEVFGRFSERSGMQNGWRIFSLQWRNIFSNYFTSYFPLLLVVLFLLRTKEFRFDGFSKVIGVALMPVFLLHLVLPNYSGHDFVSLYGAVFLSIVAGIGSQYFLKKGKSFFIAALSLYVLISIGHYYYVNRPGSISQRGDRYADYKDRGIAIGQNSNSDEVIFLLHEKPTPEIIFYAGRNILRVANEEEARQHLQKSSASTGVLFKKIANNKVDVVKRISE